MPEIVRTAMAVSGQIVNDENSSLKSGFREPGWQGFGKEQVFYYDCEILATQ